MLEAYASELKWVKVKYVPFKLVTIQMKLSSGSKDYRNYWWIIINN